MTSNYRRVTSQNTWLFEEAVRNGGPLDNNTEATRAAKAAKVRRRPKAPGKDSRDRAQMKYEGRGNMCPVCFMARPAGTKECDTCN